MCYICGKYASNFLSLPLLIGLRYNGLIIDKDVSNKYSTNKYSIEEYQKIAFNAINLSNKEEVITYLRQVMSEKK